MRHGQGQSLLTWEQIQHLHQEGVEFGSHGTTYRPLVGLPSEAVVEEVTRSRLHLTQKLGTPPLAFAYPYGEQDALTSRFVAVC